MVGCGDISSKTPEHELFVAAVWNLQALYDGRENGNEFAEYREAAGWTPEKYQARITAFSQAIQQMLEKDKVSAPKVTVPCLIGFVEVENSRVLDDLAMGALSKHGYNWHAFASLPGSPMGIGFLSRFPLKEIKAHSITTGKDTAPRPVLEVRVEPNGKPLVFLLNHWKSKLGKDTEVLRRASAKVVQRRLCELKAHEPETPVIVLGDLNEKHNEFEPGEKVSALLPDDPEAAEKTALMGMRDFLVLSGEKPPRAACFPDDVQALYSPWGIEINDGSYYYKGGWETIDHFLLSTALFDGSGWDFSDCHLLNNEPFVTSKGVPNAYAARYGRGLSDHLPLLLYLSYK